MKKLLVFTALVLFLSSLIALESDPSDVVGFVKRTATEGYSYFALPFTFYVGGTETLALDDIIGDQLTGGNMFTADRIVEKVTGTYAYFDGTNWQGALATQGFADNQPYYFQVKTGHGSQDVYLAGNVEQEIQVMPNNCAVGYSYHGIKEAGEVDVSALDLIDSGFTGGNMFTSDRFLDAETGEIAFGVEARYIRRKGKDVVYLLNLTGEEKRIIIKGIKGRFRELITNKEIPDVFDITLKGYGVMVIESLI